MTTTEGLHTPARARLMIQALEDRAEWLQLKIVAKTLAGKQMGSSFEQRELWALRWVLTLAETEWDFLARADELWDIRGRIPSPNPTPQEARKAKREKAQAIARAAREGSLDLCTAEG